MQCNAMQCNATQRSTTQRNAMHAQLKVLIVEEQTAEDLEKPHDCHLVLANPKEMLRGGKSWHKHVATAWMQGMPQAAAQVGLLERRGG